MDKSRGSGQGLLRSPTSPPKSPLPSVSAEGKIKVDKLIDQVDSIVPSDGTRAQNSFQMWLQEACKDVDTLKYAVERFHHYWLTDRPAVTKAGLFLCSNYMFEVDGQKLRQDLLLCLQKDFENRQEMQAKSPEKFLNAAAFLVEMYTHIRIEKLPLAFMITPVFQYLEDLLHGDDAEIELFAHLVVSVGPTLKEAQEGDGHSSSLTSFDPLQKLFVKVRSVLMSRNLSSQSRLWLLFIMDVSSSGDFELPSLPLQEFYRNKVRKI
ncbi:hypothetical protein ONE63_008432 [Megalurothrips usitatus]|uniref:Uncharacterized protein n=1 Tax=Megalurothrips usitatus TaxID=439358 RepID=A0AAV7XPQ7_9NEOP|nr:hypothetical protein ONE63_008432 [Megalurothrips usitatus]